MFEVTTPSQNRAILSADELRVASGLAATDTSQDGRLGELGLRAADAISHQCKVQGDGVNPPTLLSEVVRDTFRVAAAKPALVLSRRFVTAVASVAEDGVTLSASDFEVDKGSGVIRRLLGDGYACWPATKIVVSYTAGFVAPPMDLKHAAELLLRQMASQSARDPMVRRERVDGVGETEYWVGAVGGAESPAALAIANLLRPYTSYSA